VETVRSYFEGVLGLDREKAVSAAAMSGGSIASGLFWMDEGHRTTRQGIADLLADGKRPFVRAAMLAERMTAKEHEMEYLSFILSFFRDIWGLRQTGDASGLANGDLAGPAAEAARRGGAGWVETSIRKVQEIMRTLRYNVNRWLALENLIISLVSPAP
jgi:hypothetical protein